MSTTITPSALDSAQLLSHARAMSLQALTEPEAKRLISQLGIKTPTGRTVCDSSSQSLALLQDLAAPMVVKVVSTEVLHKSESGGVVLNLPNLEAVAIAIEEMQKRHARVSVSGYLVEEMAEPGVELVIGGNMDPVFGPVLMVGLGGIFVEILADISLRICPIDRHDANDMLDALRGSAILHGARGKPAVDIEAVIDAMLAIGGEDGLLMRHGNDIASLDINPLIATPTGCTAVDVRVLLTTSTSESTTTHSPSLTTSLTRLLYPDSIAVVGVSSTGRGPGNSFIRNLREFGFAGKLFIVHPTADKVDNIACYRSLGDLPQVVDYAYVAVPAEQVPSVLAAANGRVAFAQVMTSGFAEISGGDVLQTELLESARQGRVRVVGPNCLGVHSTRARVSFINKVSDTVGSFAVISQSGGMGVDILRRGQARGVRFSHLITIGNSADVSAVEILHEMLADNDVGVIGMYLESVSDGRALLQVLRSQQLAGGKPKPVLLLKGGISVQGQRAAASHTGALASNERLWAALAQQTGVAMVNTLDEFIDCALTFQLLEPNYAQPMKNICLFGNGGGTSVIACDTFSRYQLEISPFSSDTVAQLEALQLPPGASVLNPIDTPVGVLKKDEGAIAEQILGIVYGSAQADAVVLHLNLPVILGYHDESLLDNLFQAALRTRRASERKVHFALVLRSDGSEAIDNLRRAYRDAAIQQGIVVYDELPQAAQALSALSAVERYVHHHAKRITTVHQEECNVQ